MTPEDDRPGNDPGLGPDDEQSVRDLLRSAHDAPSMPSDVAGRLDEVLAGLVSERAEPAAVADLAERRRRRWPKVLVAAAAVAVVGLGVGNFVDDFGSGDTGVTTAEDAAGGDARPDAATDGEAGAALESAPGALTEKKDTDQRPSELQGLRSESLAGDAQRFADVALVTSVAADQRRSALARCEAPAARPGDEVFAVRLDGRPATIVFRKAENGVRQTDVYPCENPEEPAGTTFVTAK